MVHILVFYLLNLILPNCMHINDTNTDFSDFESFCSFMILHFIWLSIWRIHKMKIYKWRYLQFLTMVFLTTIFLIFTCIATCLVFCHCVGIISISTWLRVIVYINLPSDLQPFSYINLNTISFLQKHLTCLYDNLSILCCLSMLTFWFYLWWSF